MDFAIIPELYNPRRYAFELSKKDGDAVVATVFLHGMRFEENVKVYTHASNKGSLAELITLAPTCAKVFFDYDRVLETLSVGILRPGQLEPIRRIQKNPQDQQAYLDLAAKVKPGVRVRLANNTYWSQEELCKKAFELDRTNIDACYALATCDGVFGAIELDGGSETRQLTLHRIVRAHYRKVIAEKPTAQACCRLAESLRAVALRDPSQDFESIKKTSMEIRDLYLRAVDLDPDDLEALRGLALTLDESEQVIQLKNGTSMTGEKLAEKFQQLSKSTESEENSKFFWP